MLKEIRHFFERKVIVFSDFDETMVEERSGKNLILNYLRENKAGFFQKLRRGLYFGYKYLTNRKIEYFLDYIKNANDDVFKKTADELHFNYAWFDEIEKIKQEYKVKKIDLIIISRNIDKVIYYFIKKHKEVFDAYNIDIIKIIANKIHKHKGVFHRQELNIELDNKFEFLKGKHIIYIGDNDDSYLKEFVSNYFNAQRDD